MSDEKFLLEYERLLDKGYCDCNEMNCIDNDSPRRILRIAKNLQQENKELKKQLQKYKSLYQNEKDKNDMLKRIINRCVEEIYNLIDDCDSVIGNKESSIVSKNKLMLMQKEKIIKILDLLKEIK